GREPVRDLFRAPRPAPASVLAASVAPSDPGDLRSRHLDAVRGGPHAGEPVLHILPQPVVGGRLAHLGAAGGPVGVPLGHRGPVVQPAAAGRGVAPQLPRDRRRRPAQLASDLSHPAPLGAQHSDLLTLGKRQIAARRRIETDRRHPATLTEPSRSQRLRHAARDGGILAGQPLGDLPPEALLLLTPVDRRPSRRPQRRTPRLQRRTSPSLRHNVLPRGRCCHDQLNPPSDPRSVWKITPSTSPPRSRPPSAATPPPGPHRGARSWRGRASGARTDPPPWPDTAAPHRCRSASRPRTTADPAPRR